MKSLNHALLAALLGIAAMTGARAQTAPAATAPMADGEVRKVDRDNKKITLKHGEIKNLDMPPMTMVFQVEDAALLDNVKAGDKVRFAATQNAGRYTVTTLQPAK